MEMPRRTRGHEYAFHADSAVESLQRLDSLVEETGLGPMRDLIGRAVDMVAYMTQPRQNSPVVVHLSMSERIIKSTMKW